MLYDIVKLIRPHQWYKNLVVFAAIIFSGNLFSISMVYATFLGFLALSIISSANYVLNDIIDAEKDRHNAEKRNRPIASGRIGKVFAFFIFAALISAGLAWAYNLNIHFFYSALALFISSAIYTLLLKELAFFDVLLISLNFVIRAIGGALIISVAVSPWLVLGIFFFAIFLALGKRYGELKLLDKSAAKHRSTLKLYSLEMTNSLLTVFMGCLIMTFSLFSILSVHKFLIWSLPLFIYIVLRYYCLIMGEHIASRKPHYAIKDKPLLLASVLFVIASVLLIYAG